MGSTSSSRISSKRNLAQNHKSLFNRRARHSGSWYSSSASVLDAQLTSFLSDAAEERKLQNGFVVQNGTRPSSVPRAIVVPHAGYSYSGSTAAYSYLALMEALQIDRPSISTIVVLHPSHHVYLDGCAVSGAEYLETPIGNLPVASQLRDEILDTGHFSTMEQEVDENEHSGEMQYPFIAKAIYGMKASRPNNTVSVLPIMVGGITPQQEHFYGKILSSFLKRDTVFTVVSSDFCHWGSRFGYTPRGDASKKQRIFEYIEDMDRMGMKHISMQDPGAFAAYLKTYKNTICGRHPIGVWLNCVSINREGKGDDDEREILEIEFVKYKQSSQATSLSDSSVSYASGIARKVTS